MTAWSGQDCAEIEQVFAERLGGSLEPGERVRISGENGDDETLARLILEGSGKGERVTIEAVVRPSKAKLDLEAARYLALDAVDLLLLEYLDSGRSERPSGIWEERELEGRPLKARVARTFPSIDAKADEMLGERGHE
jgi:hypothetical protein